MTDLAGIEERHRMRPSLGITLTQSVREGLRIIMYGVPCPTCGQTGKRMSLRGAADAAGVPHTTIARFLKGHSLDSDTLDVLYEFVNARLPALTPSTETGEA